MSGHHAPRGRIKARVGGDDLMDAVKLMDAKQCRAKSKQSGQRCKRSPIPGGVVCRIHGGGSPQVIKAAEGRLEALRTPAVAYLKYLLGQREYPSAGLGAAKDVLDRIDGKAAETVRVIETTDRQLAELKASQARNAAAALARRSKASKR